MLSEPLNRPLQSITGLFLAWKSLLLLIVLFSPGPSYDTSTNLAFAHVNTHGSSFSVLSPIIQRLTRWDAIYFVSISRRGYVYEQEWAFGYGFTRLVALCTAGLQYLGIPEVQDLHSIVASTIAHIAHYLSTVIIFKLTLALFGNNARNKAFITALLHIVSPAGVFLSAPYAESLCAFLSFAGYLYYAKSFPPNGRSTVREDLLLLMAGVSFGAATTFRSNGILNGILLLEEAIKTTLRFLRSPAYPDLRRLLITGLAGLIVAAGFVLPQYVAFSEYCRSATSGSQLRSWCNKALPSIYGFVQDHYWNVGFMRYWTLSNLPLFLLAAPMYYILSVSAIWTLESTQQTSSYSSTKRQAELGAKPSHLLRSIMLPQLCLVFLNLTNAHVQIITRISSAYPVWLWYGAWLLGSGKSAHASYLVRFMVVYAVVQGSLFAAFLPPA